MQGERPDGGHYLGSIDERQSFPFGQLDGSDARTFQRLGEAILPGLGKLNGLKILLARADLARPDLPQAIRAGGGIAHDISAYRTLPSHPDSQALAEIAKGTHILTFTSPSTVENFSQIMLEQGLDPLHLPGNPITACIGPITANAARAKGFQVEVVPEDYTTEGLLQALIQYYAENKI